MPNHTEPGAAEMRAALRSYAADVARIRDTFPDRPTRGCPLCGAPTAANWPCTRPARVGALSCADVIAAETPLFTANTGAPAPTGQPIPATLRRNTLTLVGDGAVWLGDTTWRLDMFRAVNFAHFYPGRDINPAHRTTANRVLPMLHDWITMRYAARVGIPTDDGDWPIALTAAGWNHLEHLEHTQR